MSDPQPKTFQEILKQRQLEEFVGREEQLTAFGDNLTFSIDDKRRRFIFNISGQAGVGKSYLLQRFEELAVNSHAISTRVDEGQDDLPSVMARIALQLEQRGNSFKKFNERYRTYRQRLQELESDPEIPNGTSALVGKALVKTGLGLASTTPLGGLVAQMVDEDALTAQVSAWGSFVARKLTNKDEVLLMLKPVDILTPLFLDCLRAASEKNTLVLTFDTYERLNEIVDIWLRQLLEGRFGALPANIVLIIGGQYELDRNVWSPYEGLIARLPLQTFTRGEVDEYLFKRGIVDDHLVSAIVQLSGGLPLLLATLAAESPRTVGELTSTTGTAVSRFLKWVDDPRRRHIAMDASLPRLLNRDVLSVIAGQDESNRLFDWLIGMPFIKEQGDGWTYHSLVRNQMMRLLRLQSPQEWTEIHGRLAEHYEFKRDSLGLDESKGFYHSAWQLYALEAMYHRICQAPHIYSVTAINNLLQAYSIRAPIANRWARTFTEATTAVAITQGKQGALGASAANKVDLREATRVFDEIVETDVIDVKWRPIGLELKARMHFVLGDSEVALSALTQAVNLQPDLSTAISFRGMIHLMSGERVQAGKDFESALRSQENNTEAIFGLGSLSLFKGEIVESLKQFDKAAELQKTFAPFVSFIDGVIKDLKDIAEFAPDLLGTSGDPYGESPFVAALKNYVPREHSDSSFIEEVRRFPVSQGETIDASLNDSDRLGMRFIEHLQERVAAFLSNLFGRHGDKSEWNDELKEKLLSQVRTLSDKIVSSTRTSGELISLAESAYYSGEFIKALEFFEEAKLIIPKGALRESVYGLTLTALGRYPEAVHHYKEMLSTNPKDFSSLYNIAVTMEVWKGKEEARPYIKRARFKLDILNPRKHGGAKFYGLGGLAAIEGYGERALKYLEKAIRNEKDARKWAERDLAWNALRLDPRFVGLLGLSPTTFDDPSQTM